MTTTTDRTAELLNPEGLDLEELREVSAGLVARLDTMADTLMTVLVDVQFYGTRVEMARLEALDRVTALGLDEEEDQDLLMNLSDAMNTIIDFSTGNHAVIEELRGLAKFVSPDFVFGICPHNASETRRLDALVADADTEAGEVEG